MEPDPQRHKMETQHIKQQLLGGRRPSDMHDLIDSVVSSTLYEQRGAVASLERFKWQRESLRKALEEAREGLTQFGKIGEEYVSGIDKALEVTKDLH